MPWDSSSWVWGNLIETWCQPFANQWKYLTASHTPSEIGIFIYFQTKLGVQKIIWCWKRDSSCGFGVSAWSIFFSAELFLRGVSVSIHTHSSLMWQWRCSSILTSHAGRGNHALKLKSANYTAKAASNQNSCNGYSHENTVTSSEPCCHHPNHPGSTWSTVKEMTFPVLQSIIHQKPAENENRSANICFQVRSFWRSESSEELKPRSQTSEIIRQRMLKLQKSQEYLQCLYRHLWYSFLRKTFPFRQEHHITWAAALIYLNFPSRIIFKLPDRLCLLLYPLNNK